MAGPELTPTVASRGKGAEPTDTQRAKFAATIAGSEFTEAERAKYGAWAATHASRHTMYEYTDWLICERHRRRATPGAEPDRAATPTMKGNAA